MILDSHLNNEGVVFNFEPFKFDGYQDKPSKFLIDFVCDDVEYEYSFELTKNRILSESLYYYPVGRRAKVFVRDSNGKYSFGTGVINKPSDVVLNTSDKNLFLSRASSMNRELAQKLYRYFMNQFSVDDLVERPVRAIEVQYVNQTHEGDLLEVYACEPAADKSDDVAAQSTQSGGAAEDYSTQAAYTEAYMIELDGKQVVSCQIVR